MSADSEEQNRDISNDPQPKVDNKKVQDFTEDWGYQGNPSPRFTPMPYPQLYPPIYPPPFELEKQIYHDYDPHKQLQMNNDRKGLNEVPHLDQMDDDPHRLPIHYPFGYYPHMKYPPQQMFIKYPPTPQQGQTLMVPSNPWYHQRPQQLMPPLCYYPQSQFDGNQYQNTVSKELQSKVFQLVQQQKVSDFQCNCKKSKCLKLYCECFANNWVCSQSCNCQDCKNRIDNPQERSKAIEEALLRNPDAFTQCFQQKNQPQYSIQQQQDKPLKEPIKENSNVARKGCNCKKSECKKKYCECYSQNLKCNDLCKCEQCLNRIDTEKQVQQDIVQVVNKQDQVNVDIKVNQKSKKIKKIGNANEDKSDSQNHVVQLKIKLNNNNRKKQDKK